MSNYENMVKLRKMIVEFKIYLMRTQTYLAPLQLFMIFLIFLNTTVWNVSMVQAFFGTKVNFIMAGMVVFIIGVLFIGYIDTRLKMFRVEFSRTSSLERNPYALLNTVWTALLLNEPHITKKRKQEIEKILEPMLKETGMYEAYLKFRK